MGYEGMKEGRVKGRGGGRCREGRRRDFCLNDLNYTYSQHSENSTLYK